MNAQLYMLQYVQTLKYYVTNHKSLLGGYLYMHSLVRNLIAWWLFSFKWTDGVARHQAARLGYLELEPTFYEHGRLSYLVGRRNVRNVSKKRQEKKISCLQQRMLSEFLSSFATSRKTTLRPIISLFLLKTARVFPPFL